MSSAASTSPTTPGSTTPGPTTPGPTTPSPTPRSAPPAPQAGGALVTSEGSTRIADTVVSKIAGVAAREVAGIHRLGGGTARALGSLRERIPGASTSAGQGVSVEVGERQAAVDIDVVVEYGIAIATLAAAVRRNVGQVVQRMTGLEVVEVNVTVNDVHLPSDDSDDSDEGAADRPSTGPRVR